ncbi:glycosyltransferase family 9 protein [Megasphaera sp.]|uniref:glycosyltransferase family 9 protein n=1 Tax=Megasphaera sp. TaxID=2023260 RepID=UPI0025934A11|nr:glycosyltransferase family 9 protein [uncultured Megasphaera sp.]
MLEIVIYYTSLVLFFICMVESGLLIRRKLPYIKFVIQRSRYIIHHHGIIYWGKLSGARVISKLTGRMIHAFSYGYESAFSDQFLHIAFRPTGGLGDYIISAKILEELQGYGPCKITVYAEKMAFGKAIYAKRENVAVESLDKFDWERIKYDVALEVEHFVHILNWDRARTYKLAPEIYKRLYYIEKKWNKLYVDIPQQYWRERIQFERCRVLGLNRWTELRMGNAFKVIDQKVFIPIDFQFKKQWEELGLQQTKYITINFGADVMRIGQTQLKLWPKENLEKFVNIFKNAYPDYQVVQLGSADATRIKNVDIYVLGKSIELTKWILKKSSCHVDCEGGLVHLATQFGTKCIVIFGPTPVHMYGYKDNINICNEKCNNCMGIHEDWAYKCYRNKTGAFCMKSILPEYVLKHAEKVLN